MTPSDLAPALDLIIPETPGVSWRDLTPRFGAVFSLTQTGNTVLKVSANKYVTGQALLGSANGNTLFFGRDLNPYNRLVLSTTRSWNDANRNFVPDCNLTLPGTTGECGPMTNQAFGTLRAATSYDPDTLSGWGKRVYNWEFAAGVQHEILPRTSLEATYYRRTYGNWVTTDNRAVSRSNFTGYQITAPVDPRLPGGGGYVIGGLFDVNPDKVGQVDNYVTYAENFGGQSEEWNGGDVIVNSRLAGVTLMGGFSTGRLSRNTCAVVEQLPELLGPGGSADYCDFQDDWINQLKLVGSYTLPKVDIQLGGAYQNIPSNELNSLVSNYVATNAVIAPSLGRPLSGGAANVQVNLLEPGAMYGERINQLDLRFSKTFRLGGTKRATVNFDIANALNSNPVLQYSESYGTWLQPLDVLQARFFKIGMKLDF